ncbi:MAG: SUMF1/EgtB/PvdO family nonheme iron enzyme [Pirellulaceae bacterium]
MNRTKPLFSMPLFSMPLFSMPLFSMPLFSMPLFSIASILCLLVTQFGAGRSAAEADSTARITNLRNAIQDLSDTFGERYPAGPQYLSRLSELQSRAQANDPEVPQLLTELRQQALLDNPLLRDLQILIVKRNWAPQRPNEPESLYFNRLGMPSNHECNSSLDRLGWDNEIAVLETASPQGALRTLYRPDDGGYVGELDMHFAADRLMFTRSQAAGWKVWEIGVDGAGLRQVSQLPDEVDCMDPLYLPDERVVCGSTACYQSVPCWHGQRLVTNLFSMDADGSHVRRLCYDQDHDLHPTLLASGHGDVCLDAESWDRLVTWIDLNAPCHGTWSDVWPIPEDGQQRRKRLRELTGGPTFDPESVPRIAAVIAAPEARPEPRLPQPALAMPVVSDWPFDAQTARRMQAASGLTAKTVELGDVELGDAATLQLVRVPAGNFVMGDAQGQPDEQPLSVVTIDKPFWMGTTEISNAVYRQFDSSHDCRYYNKRHAQPDDKGLPLNAANQPVVRVSWLEAMAFCDWLSRKTGMQFSLPTESQWEWAARAGSASSLWYGETGTNPAPYANLAGREFGRGRPLPGLQQSGGVQHLLMDGAWMADQGFDDGAIVTQSVGGREPSVWGLFDMAGNAAEWTRSEAAAYPYMATEDLHASEFPGRKIVRGGSFFDRPARARSASRLSYPQWQRVFNVGFRVVCEDPQLAAVEPSVAVGAADPVCLRVESLTLLPQSQPVACVRVRNISGTPYAGEVKLHAPDAWRITPAVQHVQLAPGEERRLAFSVEGAQESPANVYPIEVTAANEQGLVTRRQEIAVASAPYFKPAIDGDPSDWKDAIAAAFVKSGCKTTISTFWNRRSFSILVAVDEDALCLPGQREHFDAVQFSLAARDTVSGQSGDAPAQRFEYLLVSQGPEKAACYQLTRPATKLAETTVSRALEPLVNPQVELAVRRIEQVTYYECSLPWDEMRQVLQPAEGREIYLSVLVHDPDGTGIREWGDAAGLWESQRNWFNWSNWSGAQWGDRPPLDSRTEWGLCSSRY